MRAGRMKTQNRKKAHTKKVREKEKKKWIEKIEKMNWKNENKENYKWTKKYLVNCMRMAVINKNDIKRPTESWMKLRNRNFYWMDTFCRDSAYFTNAICLSSGR